MIADLTVRTVATLNQPMSGRRESSLLARGFPPVVGSEPRVLLLGSLPGAASIAAGQYYAMPRNAFWTIMGSLCGAGPELAYELRLAALQHAGIALWDVLQAAVRPGSLDASILASTQQVNDIVGLVARHRSIRLIGCNGRKAASIFARQIAPQLPRTDIDCVDLPSTSPAYASLRPDAKLHRWRSALMPYLRAD
jgi:hypoxanthine-DNA glycosylase